MDSPGSFVDGLVFPDSGGGKTQNPIERMCLKYLPNTTRGIKPMIIYLINEMEMKNAAYAADLFAIEKNGLN